MGVYRQPERHFSPGEYLLADSAYALSKHCVPAYKSPATNLSENRQFNFFLPSSQVHNEHCIGMLKNRWACLKEARQQLQSVKDMCTLIDWTVACCVLHNMLGDFGDAWDDYENDDPDKDLDPPHDPTLLTVATETFRENLKKVTLETNKD
jgi:hypothetical protein